MNRLTHDEKQNCIGYKSLLIAKDRQGVIARITSPSYLSAWEWDGSTWTLKAHELPTEQNTAGVYVTFKAQTAHEYLGTLCKVVLSGTVVIGEHGARGEFARVLEIGTNKRRGIL